MAFNRYFEVGRSAFFWEGRGGGGSRIIAVGEGLAVLNLPRPLPPSFLAGSSTETERNMEVDCGEMGP